MAQPLSVRKNKFLKEDKQYFDYIAGIDKENVDVEDVIFQFPLYVGQVNLARFLTFYEAYQKVVNISGAIADVGTWKGASLLTLAKLSHLLEPHSNTDLYGFDWFEGTKCESSDATESIFYKGDQETLEELIKAQGYDDRITIENMDLTQELDAYFSHNKWLRFKFIFMDCGVQEVLEKALPLFWDKLSPGGILMLDHYNHPSSPYESDVVQSIIGNRSIQQLSFSRSPTGFVIK